MLRLENEHGALEGLERLRNEEGDDARKVISTSRRKSFGEGGSRYGLPCVTLGMTRDEWANGSLMLIRVSARLSVWKLWSLGFSTT